MKKSGHTGRPGLLGGPCVHDMCSEQLYADVHEVSMQRTGEEKSFSYLVPRFLQYHTEREGRPKPEGDSRAGVTGAISDVNTHINTGLMLLSSGRPVLGANTRAKVKPNLKVQSPLFMCN